MRRFTVRCANGALAGLAALSVSGCVGRTYGTGENPEIAMFREVTGGMSMGLVPTKKKASAVDYQPRAPLVMPPSGEQLPPPAQIASAANPDWPVEPDRGGRRFDEDARAGGSRAEYERLKPLGALAGRGAKIDENVDDRQDAAYDVVRSKKQRETFQAALDDKNGVGRTERRYLTEPPDTMRTPAAGAPQTFEDIKPQRKSWLAGLLGG